MLRRLCRHDFFLASLYVFLFAARCLAQDASTGALRGAVTDATGGLIGNATIALVNEATGTRYSIASDSDGRFVFQLLPPGDYSARAEAEGMSPQMTPRLRVDIGATTEIEFKLGVAGAKETVTVSGAPPLVETSPSAVSSLIDDRAIGELPLDGRRFTDLALTGTDAAPRLRTRCSEVLHPEFWECRLQSR